MWFILVIVNCAKNGKDNIAVLKKLLLNKYALIVFVIGVIVLGCFWAVKNEDIQKGIKHNISSAIGLDRVVQVINAQGEVIRTWEGRFKIEPFGAGISFLDKDNNEVKIMGPCIVQEVD